MLKWLAIHTQRAGWTPVELARATAGEGGALPEVEFIAEAQRCDVCDHPLAVLKSRRRRVVTLEAGTFVAKEVLKYCPGDASHPVLGSSVLARLVKPCQRYGYDLVVYVGLARYLRGKQRIEIQAELLAHRGIELSEASISNLCDRFLGYLEVLHLARAPALRAAMSEGYPLHIDATRENGRGGLFVCMNGWRGWVLMATRIPSEHTDHLRPTVGCDLDLMWPSSGYWKAVLIDLSPELFPPLRSEHQCAQTQNDLRPLLHPAHSGVAQTLFDQRLARCFGDTGADG